MNAYPMYLTINTSSDLLTVTLTDSSGLVLDNRSADAHLNHASLLMPTIKDVLKGKEAELKGIICAKGPGSFTGIRIGLTSANALAYGFDIPIVGVSMLDAWLLYALHFFTNRDTGLTTIHGQDLKEITSAVTLIDAGRDEAYMAVFKRDETADPTKVPSWQQSTEPHLVSLPVRETTKPAITPPLLTELPDRSIIAGALKAKHADDLIPAIGSAHLSLIHFDHTIDLGREIAELGNSKFQDMKTFADSGQIAPLYIREAQITKSKKETLA